MAPLVPKMPQKIHFLCFTSNVSFDLINPHIFLRIIAELKAIKNTWTDIAQNYISVDFYKIKKKSK